MRKVKELLNTEQYVFFDYVKNNALIMEVSMKTSIRIAGILVLALTVACSGSRNTSGSANNDSESIVLAKDLPRYVDNLPRISVRGSGDNVTAINTSAATFSGSTAPLFVLDNIQIGRSFSQVMRLLDDNQAVSVEYLTTRRATIRYGEDGNNGVIILSRVQGG